MTSPINSPSRTLTEDDSALGDDPSETTKLLHERLQAYKHACGYIEDYVKSCEKMQTAHSKEYEKVLKTINNPLKEGEQFDHNPGGIAGMFDTMRTNTQAISNSHTQTATSLRGSVLPVFERLHQEIKAKQKELAKGVGKGSKAVDKARADTQKHVDLLASSTNSFGGKDANNDPYLLQRRINHRLNKQFGEENNHRQDLISVQNNFAQFERQVVQTLQQGMGLYNQTMNNQADQQKALYSQIIATVQSVEPLHEWDLFVQRNSNVLIDPRTPPKTLANATFPNQNHKLTVPLCQGALERKQGLMRKFESSFYVITPANFLHEFKTEDDLAKDPTPELSLYLPDCTTGGLNGNLFSIKGKDLKGMLSTNKEYEFRTTTGTHAESWYNVIIDRVGSRPSDSLSPTSPVSPSGSLAHREVPAPPPISTNVGPTSELQTGTTPVSATPGSAHPMSATSATNPTPTTTTAPGTVPNSAV